MSTDCFITFDYPSGIYNSGDTLNGHVKLQTEKSKSIRGISIKIIGYGTVFWSEPIGRSSTCYKSDEQYLNSVTYVIGEEGGESFHLEPGIYDYTFTCSLPIELPTSINEDIGKIKYKVIVTIDRPLRFDNVFKKDFIVKHSSDLNLISINKNPIKVISVIPIKSLFRLCCYDDGEIRAELEIPCTGYVPGQNFPYKLIVYNNSNNNLSGAKVKLMKFYKFRSTKPYRKEKVNQEEILRKYLNNIPRNTNKEFNDNFHLPDLLPTHHTRIIQLDYKLIVKILGYMLKNIYIEIPIIIGTIPLVDFDPYKSIINIPTNLDDDNMDSINSTAEILPN